MRKFYALLFSCCLFCCSIYLTSFRAKQIGAFASPANKLFDNYQADLRACGEQVTLLSAQIEKIENAASLAKAQSTFKKARLTYKKVEPLATYFNEEFITDYINGAPLPKLERNAPSLSVLEPKGFQVLEEALFAQDALEQKEEILKLARQLDAKFAELVAFQPNLRPYDRHIFEAVRLELIRIFTLGLTGFDSPVLQQSLPEAEQSLEGCFILMRPYLNVVAVKEAKLAQRINKNFQQGITYLKKNQDFNSFDRIGFLKQYINPLFEDILKVHLALGIETVEEVSPVGVQQSWNYRANNIFDNNFLNPTYYGQLNKKDYNEKVVKLGKYLFFDPVLSSNNQRSCASCHQPEKGFTDGLPKSIAFDFKGALQRNSPTLLNAVFAKRFFYDLRSESLKTQLEHVITSPEEFHTSYLSIFEKLKKSNEYTKLFKEAFPYLEQDAVSIHSVSTALTAFVTSLHSFNSPFDRFVRGEQTIDKAVVKGANLFMGKAGCATCHFAPTFNGLVPPLFAESESEVLGVPADTNTVHPTIDADKGRRFGVLKENAAIYDHSFKTTTVRNVALTAPYMHNGVYATLEEVVDFYDRGGGVGLGLEVSNQTLPSDPLNLTEEEKNALVAFMKSLTDTTGLTDRPRRLPDFQEELVLNKRKVGGEY